MSSIDIDDMKVDQANLYREEMLTDLHVATIRRLTPIKVDGSTDSSRDTIFSAQTHIMSQMGALPVNCPLKAKTLEAAVREFPEAIKEAVERMVDEVREYQRQEASRIVVARPGAVPPGGGAGPAGGPAGPSRLIV